MLLDSNGIPGVSSGLGLIFISWVAITSQEDLVFPRRLLVPLLPLVTLVLVGLHGFFHNSTGDVLRDGWYFINPILSICFGYYWIQKRRLGDLIDVYAFCSVILSLGAFVSLYRNFSQAVLLTDIEQYRELVGKGVMMPVITMGMIWMARSASGVRSYVLDRRWLRRLVLIVLFAGIAITFSRTLIICAVTGYVASLSWRQNRRRVILVGVAALVLFIFSLGGVSSGDTSDSSFFSQFLDKISHSGQEVNSRQFNDFSDIQSDWRSYETYRAEQQFHGFDAVDKWIGGGFGQLIDLQLQIELDSKYFTRIPITHNGYAFILVKTGVIGELLYATFILMLATASLRAMRSRIASTAYFGKLAVWSLLVLLMTQGVLRGLYARDSFACLIALIGMSIFVTSSGDDHHESLSKTHSMTW